MRKYITIVIKDQGRGHNLQSTPIRNLPCVVLDDKAAYVTILVYVLEKKFQQISYCNNMSVFHYLMNILVYDFINQGIFRENEHI